MDSCLNDFIDNLNGDLALERKAQVQYEQHSALLSGPSFAFADNLLEHAEQENAHANKLNDLIVFLGGVPTIEMTAPETSEDNSKMFRQDLSGEIEAIQRYKERLCQAREYGYYEAEGVLLYILDQEVHHANELMSIIGG